MSAVNLAGVELSLLRVIKGLIMRIRIISLITYFLFASLGLADFFSKNENYFEKEEGQKSLIGFLSSSENNSEAQWLLVKNKIMNQEYRSAKKNLKELYERWPNSLEAPGAVILHAQILKDEKKWDSSFNLYQYAIDNYINRLPLYGEVLAQQYDIALSVMEERRLEFVFGGYQVPEMAIPYFEKIIINGPKWIRAPEAMFNLGKCHQLAGAYEEAITAYLELNLIYPEHDLAEQALWSRIECLKELRKKYPISPQIMNRIIIASTLYLSSYSDSDRKNEIIFLRNELYNFQAKQMHDQAIFYEKIAKNENAALKTYQSIVKLYPKSKYTDDALNKISNLESKLSNKQNGNDS